jgi:MSHA pilin protein MshC
VRLPSLLVTVRTGGFTLIELIVVIMLMAILAAAAAPRFFDSGAFEGPAFAQEVASAARYAQKLAVTSGCPVRFIIPDATHYELRQPQSAPAAGCDTTFTRAVPHPGSGSDFAAAAPAGVTLAVAVPLTIEFRSDGAPYDVGAATPRIVPATIVIAGKSVVITARSGYVDVQ